jgi:hypothetical protein
VDGGVAEYGVNGTPGCYWAGGDAGGGGGAILAVVIRVEHFSYVCNGADRKKRL